MRQCSIPPASPATVRAFLTLGMLLAAILIGPVSARAQGTGAGSLDGEGGGPLFVLPSGIDDLSYTPGRGLRLGDTRVTLGGYTNVNLTRDEGRPAELNLDDLSTFVIWDPLPRFRLFSELEFEDLLVVNSDGEGGTPAADFVVERLYGEATVSDQLNVRFGKFLTPVGRWNVIHAQPLVWTTSRPLVTLLPFDPHTTGAMLFGTVFPSAGTLTYSAYGQFLNQFEPEPFPQTVDRSAGARLEYAGDAGASIGASYLAFTAAGTWRHLGGVDLLWRHGPLELMGEFAYVGAPRAQERNWGLYLQPVLQVLPKWYVVGRYEHFAAQSPPAGSPPPAPPEVNLIVSGVAYKPQPYLVLKAEYLFADHVADESPPGLKLSFAILF